MMIQRAHAGSGNIMTLGQFVLISVTGFFGEARCGRKRSAVPIQYTQFQFIKIQSFKIIQKINQNLFLVNTFIRWRFSSL
jgi:hypothetical protein